MICYWCHWGWPKPIREIYEDALEQLRGDAHPLHYGPAHVVWDDENWDRARWCLSNFSKYANELTDHEKTVVRESLERLLAVPNEFKYVPDEYDGENPGDFPPPAHWECKRIL